MHNFMTHIGYTLINTKEEFEKFKQQFITNKRAFFSREYYENDFPLYMKVVITDDNGYGDDIVNFSTVDPKEVSNYAD